MAPLTLLSALQSTTASAAAAHVRAAPLVDRLTEQTPPAYGTVTFLLIGAAIAGVLIIPSALWRVTGLIVTIVHELGHGFAGLMLGRRALAIRIAGDHSGLALSYGTGASAPWMTFWGYPAPALVGSLLIFAALYGYPLPALAAAAVLLFVSLIFMRGFLAITVTALTAAGIGALVNWAPAQVTSAAALGAGLFLLIGAWKGFANLLRAHARGDRGQSDAAILARATRIPAVIWLALMFLVMAGCTALSAWGVWLQIVGAA